jgi:hypothetical protein
MCGRTERSSSPSPLLRLVRARPTQYRGASKKKPKPVLKREYCQVHIIRHRGAWQRGNRNRCLNENIARFASLGTAELAERKSKPGFEREHCEVHIVGYDGASRKGERNQVAVSGGLTAMVNAPFDAKWLLNGQRNV